ncbi:MAG: ATP-binding protein [Thermomicrobiales bacterium]
MTHRSYSQQGDHIRVVLFDDRLEVTSPGRLPGPVRLDNIRYTRFSRNPRIARILADLQIVRELNEGVNRMFADMASAGLPDPELHQSDSEFKVILYIRNRASEDTPDSEWDNPVIRSIMRNLSETGRASVASTVAETGMSAPTVRRHFQRLSDAGIIQRVARSVTDPRAHWIPRKPDSQ